MASFDSSDDKKSADKAAQSSVTPEQAEKPDPSRFGMEFGVDTNLPFATPFRASEVGLAKNQDEELQEILREESENYGPTVNQLVAMRRMDGQARALYRLMTLPILSALTKATFVPADGGETEAEFIEQALTTPPESGGMTVTMHRFMRQMLMALFDGFSAFEKVFWIPEFGPMQGKITLKKLANRPTDTVTFISDKQGGFAGLRQRASQAGKVVDVYIPREYSFYFAAQEEERKFYGVSFFQSAFYHYDKKVKLYYIAHLAAQRSAVGTRAGTFPANATEAQKRDFAAQLNNLALAQWMMLPENFKVEVLKDSGTFNFLEMINHHNSQMSKSILASFLDNDAGGSTGQDTPLINNSQPGDEMFKLMMGAVMDEVANQINHYIIPQLIDFNFGSGKYPKFTWGKLTDDQKNAISSTFDKLASQQTVTPEFIRALEEHQAEEFGLDIDYDEIEEREAEQAAAMEAAGAQIDPATGLPVQGAPGDPAAAGGDEVSQFEQQAMALSAALEDEPSDSMLKLAGQLLEAAYDDID